MLAIQLSLQSRRVFMLLSHVKRDNINAAKLQNIFSFYYSYLTCDNICMIYLRLLVV